MTRVKVKTERELISEIERLRKKADSHGGGSKAVKRLHNQYNELVRAIRFLGDISEKVHGLPSESEIYSTLLRAFTKSHRYHLSILLLTDKKTHLRVAGTSISSKKMKMAEKATGLRHDKFRIDLSKSETFRRVLVKGESVHLPTKDLMREVFPRGFKKLVPVIAKLLHYERKTTVLVPTYSKGVISGAFAITPPELFEDFIPSAESFSRQVSTAVDLANQAKESREAEGELQKSKGRFRQLFSTVSDAIMVFEVESKRFIDVNQSALDLYGYTREEFLGMTHTDITVEKALSDKNIRETTIGTPVRTSLLYHKKKDGTVFPVEISGSRTTLDGKDIACRVVRDITKQKQAHKSLEYRLNLEHLVSEISGDFINIPVSQMDDQINGALEKIARFTDAKRSSFFTVSAELKTVTNTHEWCATKNDSQIKQLQNVPFDMFAYHKKQMTNLEIIKISCVDDYPPEATQELAWIKKYGFRSMLFIPIAKQGLINSAIGIYGDIDKEIEWSDDFIDFLSLIGNIIANCLERKKIEIKLLNNEKLLFSIAENYPNSYISIIEKDYTVGFTSGQEFKKQGLDPQQYIGLKLEQVFDDKTDYVREFYKKTFNGEECTFELFFHDQYQLYRTVPLYAGNGSIDQILVVVENITDRKLAEKALKASEQLLKKAQEIAHIGHFKFDPQTQVVEGSDELFAIFGLTRKEFQFSNFVNSVHPEDREFVTLTIDSAVNRCIGYEIEHRLLLRDGTLKYIQAIGEPITGKGGKTSLMIGTVQEITDLVIAQETLQKSESLHKTMIANISDVIGIVDQNAIITYKSPNIERLFGWKPKDLVGTDLLNTVHPDDLKRFQKEFANLLASEKNATATMQYRLLCKDGSFNHVHMSATNLIHDEQVNGLLMNYHDITERIKAEDEKRRLENQLRQSEKMQAIGQLAGGIAHDFNNQLGGILGYADLIREDVSDHPELTRYADNILTSIKRSSDLTAQLLAFSRQGKYHDIVVDMHIVLREVVSILKRSIDKRIVIRQHLNANPPSTKGDPTQLQNALLNIALNARDAMPKGGKLIFMTEIKQVTDSYEKSGNFDVIEGTYLKVSVTDTGIGMDKETQLHAFEPFFTTKDRGKGTGMGLAAVYGTVKNHKGFIHVDSKPGLGTNFSIFLPLAERELSQPETISQSNLPKTGNAAILLVEDEQMLREATKELLMSLGYTVTACADGKEAVAFYEKFWKKIDLVLLDMVMPVMDGRDTFNAMRKINPEIQVLLSSGYSLNGKAKSILEDGVKGFIQKPYRKTELAEKIAELLD